MLCAIRSGLHVNVFSKAASGLSELDVDSLLGGRSVIEMGPVYLCW